MFKVSTKCVWHLLIKQSFHGIMGGECCPVQCDLTVSFSTTAPDQRERLQSKAIYSRPWITWGSSGFACNEFQMNRCHVALSHFCTHFDWAAHTRPTSLHCLTVLLLTYTVMTQERKTLSQHKVILFFKSDLFAIKAGYSRISDFIYQTLTASWKVSVR